jgi:5-methylcytosine-specific restriction endonuclease McrBC GTP-binding regulatory subunit McrB
MKNFIQKNFTVIVLVIALLTLFKSCGDSRELSKMRKEVQTIKDSTYTKVELDRELKIMGLESEKRMIQATDRKLLDVQRQTQIEEEIKSLKTK